MSDPSPPSPDTPPSPDSPTSQPSTDNTPPPPPDWPYILPPPESPTPQPSTDNIPSPLPYLPYTPPSPPPSPESPTPQPSTDNTPRPLPPPPESPTHQWSIGASATDEPPPSKMSTGVIVGIAVGVLAILLLFSILLYLYFKRKKNRRRHEEENSAPPHEKFDPNDHSHQSPSLPRFNTPPPWTFTYEELARATDDFSDVNFLGQGGFGYVHRGVLPNGKEVAIKQLKAGSVQGEREFRAEVDIISRVHHRHLVSLVGYCITGTHRLLVYDFVPNKTLDFHLHGKGEPAMDWSTRLRIALGAAKGLSYIHEDCQSKIIHRDIKAANISI